MAIVLDASAVAQFAAEGALVVNDLFPSTLAEEALATDVAQHLDAVLDAFAAANPRSALANTATRSAITAASVVHRLALAEAACPGISVVVHKTAWAGNALRRIWAHERVVGAVDQLLGAVEASAPGSRCRKGRGVAAHPAFNLRCKPPVASSTRGVEGNVPWHQDVAYVVTADDVRQMAASADAVAPGACATPQLTMWVPLVDMAGLGAAEEATTRTDAPRDGSSMSSAVRAGPLEVALGPWCASPALLPHDGVDAGTWYVSVAAEAGASEDGSTVQFARRRLCHDVRPGGAVFFTSYTPHRALPNTLSETGAARWTADFRFQRPGLETGCECDALPLDGAAVDWEALPCCRRVDCAAEAARVLSRDEGGGDRAAPSFLEPVIGGPWMDAWPMPRPSLHLAAYRDGTVAFPAPRYAGPKDAATD
jgi:ectoine hydroxylase-related dioxygenase (phytanoyl-CoA dioxygenase family)